MKPIAATGVGFGCITLLAAGWYLISPYTAVERCRNAIIDLNAEKASECVDFPELRESLKSELPTLMAKEMQQDPEMRDNPFANFGMALIIPMVSALVDAYVTPAGIKTAFEIAKANQTGREVKTDNEGEETAGSSSEQLSNSLLKTSSGYKGLDKFQMTGTNEDGSKVMLIFNRQGFSSWKLTKIKF